MLFFFQAEDGIRDPLVTGVQTCALPISRRPQAFSTPLGCGEASAGGHIAQRDHRDRCVVLLTDPAPAVQPWFSSASARSKERRVGKERRSRWRTSHSRESGETVARAERK